MKDMSMIKQKIQILLLTFLSFGTGASVLRYFWKNDASIWALAIGFIAGNNLVTSWDTELGRFWSTVIDMNLMVLFVFSVVLIVLGIVLMMVELFRKEK